MNNSKSRKAPRKITITTTTTTGNHNNNNNNNNNSQEAAHNAKRNSPEASTLEVPLLRKRLLSEIKSRKEEVTSTSTSSGGDEREREPVDDDDDAVVIQCTDADVLSSANDVGGVSQSNVGNKAYRDLCLLRYPEFQASSEHGGSRRRIAAEIVSTTREKAGGRFLMKKKGGAWSEMPTNEAIAKVSKDLRTMKRPSSIRPLFTRSTIERTAATAKRPRRKKEEEPYNFQPTPQQEVVEINSTTSEGGSSSESSSKGEQEREQATAKFITNKSATSGLQPPRRKEKGIKKDAAATNKRQPRQQEHSNAAVRPRQPQQQQYSTQKKAGRLQNNQKNSSRATKRKKHVECSYDEEEEASRFRRCPICFERIPKYAIEYHAAECAEMSYREDDISLDVDCRMESILRSDRGGRDTTVAASTSTSTSAAAAAAARHDSPMDDDDDDVVLSPRWNHFSPLEKKFSFDEKRPPKRPLPGSPPPRTSPQYTRKQLQQPPQPSSPEYSRSKTEEQKLSPKRPLPGSPPPCTSPLYARKQLHDEKEELDPTTMACFATDEATKEMRRAVEEALLTSRREHDECKSQRLKEALQAKNALLLRQQQQRQRKAPYEFPTLDKVNSAPLGTLEESGGEFTLPRSDYNTIFLKKHFSTLGNEDKSDSDDAEEGSQKQKDCRPAPCGIIDEGLHDKKAQKFHIECGIGLGYEEKVANEEIDEVLLAVKGLKHDRRIVHQYMAFLVQENTERVLGRYLKASETKKEPDCRDPYKAEMSSFRDLFCRRCLTYDCNIHGLSDDFCPTDQAQLAIQKELGGFWKVSFGI
jgi:hypothetical protein